MDHISKALELARTHRRQNRRWQDEITYADEGFALDGLTSIVLSREHLVEHRILSGDDREDPFVSDKYRLLRRRVIQEMARHGWRSLGITSPGPKVGKTVTAINLAISMARDRHDTVVLVDADLKNPSIGPYLGLDRDLGLIDFLSSDMTVEDVLVSPDIENLFVMPGRRDETQAVPELMTSKKMGGLVRSLSASGNAGYVVFDLPPVLVGDYVLAVAPLLDCLLLVIEDGRTEVPELAESVELVQAFNLLGTVLNNADETGDRFEGYYHSGHGGSSSAS